MNVLDLHTGQQPPAPGTSCDIVVARDWEATAWLWDVDARRRVYAVDHFAHEALGPWQAERIAAALTYDLPVDFLAYGEVVADRLGALRPEARVEIVRPGVERAPAPNGRREGHLRVAGAQPELLARMAEPHEVAEADAADVLVVLDGQLPLDGPVLRAVCRGVVPIVLPTAPAAEVAVHLETGIVAEPDDAIGTARWLDTLARDDELLARLRAGALELASGWPTPDNAAAQERAALQRLLDTEPAATDLWGSRVMADAMAAVAVWRNEYYKLSGELQRIERDETYQAGLRARDLWRNDRRLAPLRRLAAPVLLRARKHRS